MFLGAIFVLGVLCSPLGVKGLDCSNKASIQREQMKCFSDSGLSLGSDFDDLQNVIQKDPQVACRNPEKYKTALKCATEVAKGCLRRIGQSTDILPDADKMSEGLNYMCSHMDEMDNQCAQEKQGAMKQCAMNKAIAIFSGGDYTDIKTITCKAFEITVDCIHEELASCSGRTEEITAYFTEHYLTPPACGTPSSGSDYGTTTVAPLTTAQLFTGVQALPDVACYSQSSIQRGQKECFDREGIRVQLPQVSVGDGGASKQSYIDAVLSNNKDMSAVCRDLPRYQRALSCAIEVGRKCMPTGYEDYLPSSSNMRSMLTYTCDNVDDIDQSCVTSKASAMFDCGYQKGIDNPVRDPKLLLCNAFRWSVDCSEQVLPPCGCKTTRVYTRIAMEYLNPPACARIVQPLPECKANTDEFVSSRYYGGGASQNAMSVFLVLLMAALLVVIPRV